MKFRTRIILPIVLTSAFLLVALFVALSGMQHVKNRFENYLATDQAILMAGNNAYAQGLQMGQAVRNIILDPKNPTAYKNFEQASKDFQAELVIALDISSKTAPKQHKTFQEIASLREKQSTVQSKVIDLAKAQQGEAIQYLNKEETPLWRQIKANLVGFVSEKGKDVEAIKSQLFDITQKIYLISVILTVASVVLGIVVSFIIIGRILKQLGGDPSVALDVAGKIAAGDLSIQIDTPHNDNSSLLFALRKMRDNLLGIVSHINDSANAIAISSNEIAGGNQDLSARNERQAASLEETASSMQQLTSSVRQNLNDIQNANNLTASASDIVARGGQKVAEVISTMETISASSRKIVDIISVIDSIAFQTNILALNAAVEAARAGEQGKGFAVVASDVRNLAQRSAAAAREIKELIENSVSKVELGSLQVNEAGTTIDEAISSIRRVQQIMGEIDSSFREQTEGIGVVNNAISQIDSVTQQNAALVEQAAAAAESLRDQSTNMVNAVRVFRFV